MVETGAAFGAISGALMSIFTDSIMRLPLTRHFHLRVAFSTAGYLFLPWCDGKVEEAKAQVREKQRDKMERNVTFEA